MIEHALERRVRHAPDDVFALVSDVRDYPRFIRWIRAMRVYDEAVENGAGALTAEALVGFKMVRERFTTRVSLDPSARTVDVVLVRGPFRALVNHWRMTPLSDGSTRVAFSLACEFSNPLLTSLLASNMDRAVHALISAFDRRAAERFGYVGDANADPHALLAQA